jgi:mercuric ion binding protein
MPKFSALLVLAFLFTTSYGHAETQTVEVSGMTCGACVKQVKAKVCSLKGIEKCEVSVGKVTLTTKAGETINQDEIAQAISAASPEFKVVTPK